MKFFWSKKKGQKSAIEDSMVTGRAHGLMALWAAERMEKTSEAAANYADEIVDKNSSDEDFLKRLVEDLTFHEKHVDEEELRERLDGFKVVAKLEFEDEMSGGC